MTPQVAVALIVLVWVIPVLLFLPWLFVYREETFIVDGFDYVVCHADWPSHNINVLFTLGVVFVTCYLIPLCIIAVLYLLIGTKVCIARYMQVHFNSPSLLPASVTSFVYRFKFTATCYTCNVRHLKRYHNFHNITIQHVQLTAACKMHVDRWQQYGSLNSALTAICFKHFFRISRG